MKKLTIFTILLTIWVGVFSQGTINLENTGNSANNKSYHPSGIEDYIEWWFNQGQVHIPGLSTAVLKNGELYWVYHKGLANVQQEIPVNDSSCFRIGSISKTVGQTAIMQQYDQGVFWSLHDSINKYLPFPVVNPFYPDNVITLFHLMTHTSSIKDNWSMMDQGSLNQSPLSEFLEGYLTPGGIYYNQYLNFYNIPPGSQWNYSNVGSTLLAYITECMAGQDFNEYCIQNIFNPIGINNASFDLNNINASHRVIHYTWNGSQYVEYPYPLDPGPYSYYPSGNLRISAVELAKFLGMYMQEGTFNDSTILQPETIELIHTPTSFITFENALQCLTWNYSEYYDIYYHTGGNDATCTIMAYDKDDQWGIIIFMNSNTSITDVTDFFINMEYFASVYNPFAVASLELNDTDGDQVIEANEEFEVGLSLRNDMNYPDIAENIIATMSVNSPYVNLISDSVVSLGTLNYLGEIQLPSDQFVFEVNEDLEPGNVEFQIQFTWDNGVGYTLSFNLFVGHADVLLVRDEESISVSFSGGLKTIQDRYLGSLDTLGFSTNYWDLDERGDPTPEFIQNFPAVIWFTGADEENTLSENNQSILEGYLDNGGQLFLSGQDISDELAGSNFLENYLFTEHIQDTWYGNKTIKGIENDPIGNGQIYQLNQGDGIANQTSMSVVEPLEGAFKSFGYYPPLDGAAVRYENDTYKTIFFAFGFEAINGLNNRTDILDRILNDYFVMPHPCLPEGITFTTQEEIDNFQTNYPDCDVIEGDVEISSGDISNLNGLNLVSSIFGSLTINDNDILTDLAGLENLNSIGENLSITGNDVLSSLTGFQNLISIGGKLEISNNSLTALTGLENLTSINGDLVIVGTGLTSLSGLDNIEASSISNLTIRSNYFLTSCDVQSICEYLSSPGGIVNVYENSTGCNNPPEIASACGITLPCLPYGNYNFQTQTQIDDFQTNYPNCTEIKGDMIICNNEMTGNLISNLNGLSVVTQIEGNLIIARNNLLLNLTGLDNVTHIGGDLTIGWNQDLNSLAGLENLTAITGELNIGYCHQAGCFGNPSLLGFTGLSSLTSIGSNFSIIANASLVNFNGLDTLTSIGGSLIVGTYGPPAGNYGNYVLESFDGIDNLTSIGGELKIRYNNILTTLSGLDNIDTASITDLTISNNPQLYDCDVWSICQYLNEPGGTAVIENNATECNSIGEVQEHCLTEIEELPGNETFNIFPNPLGSATLIQYTLQSNSKVTLKILDLSGKEMLILVNEKQPQGDQQLVFNTSGLPAGVYFCILKTSAGMQTKKLIKME